MKPHKTWCAVDIGHVGFPPTPQVPAVMHGIVIVFVYTVGMASLSESSPAHFVDEDD